MKIICSLLLTLGFSTAHASVIVADGGFEGGTPNPSWTESSSNFGTPLCTITDCGDGGGTGPRSGSWWAWFGGVVGTETGSVLQKLLIPTGTAVLNFWFENYVSDSDDDFIKALIDDIPVWTYTGFDYLNDQLGYTQITVNIDAFADGGMHTLEFFSTTISKNNGVTNFFVDDVSITTVPEPATLALLGLGLAGFGFSKKKKTA